MILTALILGVVGALLVSFWDEIVNWLKKVVHKVADLIKRTVVGVKIFLKKMSEAIKEIAKNYSQDENGRWHETIVTREIPESEVPADILAKVRKSKEIDVSNELELQLEA